MRLLWGFLIENIVFISNHATNNSNAKFQNVRESGREYNMDFVGAWDGD